MKTFDAYCMTPVEAIRSVLDMLGPVVVSVARHDLTTEICRLISAFEAEKQLVQIRFEINEGPSTFVGTDETKVVIANLGRC